MRTPGVRTLLGATVAFGAGSGLVQVAVATSAVRDPAAGLALTAMSAGSVLGGILYGGRDWPGTSAGRFVLLQLLLAAGLATSGLAGSPLALSALLAAAGTVLAPIAAENAVLVNAVAPPGTLAECSGWLLTAVAAGEAAGTAAGGPLAGRFGDTTALLAAAAVMAVAATATAACTRGLDACPPT